MAETLIGHGIVVAAALYVGWKFMPAAWRRWLAARIAASMRGRGLAPGRVAWLEAKLTRGGACGSCDTCKACDADKRAADARGRSPG